MVFSSLTFLCVFLPVVFALYYLLPSIRLRNALLIVASLLFYAYGEPVYVLLMIASTVANYLFGLVVGSSSDTKKKLAVAASVAVNIGVLCIFKYTGMIVASINALTGASIPDPQITLPIGISFFTFQAMSYVIDVYRGQVNVDRSYTHVLLYISFFPQLIAGPIVKYHDIAEQIGHRTVCKDEIARGLRRFCVGLAKKVLIANQVALVADTLFSAPAGDLNILSAWLAAVAYAMQIYFDFSAYSDMAIGLGHMFGFSFKENFNYPYKSKSIQEFWRRWHISLSTWFKEYLYFPLGGNRKGGKGRTAFNKVVVFFFCGLWHGASWTFVVWGLFHGLFLLIEMFVPQIKKLPPALGHVYSMLVILVGWVIFRADTFVQSLTMLGTMFAGFTFTTAQASLLAQQLTPMFIVTMLVALVAALPVKQAFQARLEKSTAAASLARPASYVMALVLLALCVVELSGGGYNPFIYFRF